MNEINVKHSILGIAEVKSNVVVKANAKEINNYLLPLFVAEGSDSVAVTGHLCWRTLSTM